MLLVLLFGLTGAAALLRSSAATQTTLSVEAESYSAQINTETASESSVSGSKFVTFHKTTSPPIGPLGFTQEVISGSDSGDCKALADFDGDGMLDGAIGGGAMNIYRNSGPAPWQSTNVAQADNEFTTDCQAADVDKDGFADIITPDYSNKLLWLKNPGSAGGNWQKISITDSTDHTHDVEVGDVNADGKIDVLTRGQSHFELWLQQSPTSWTKVSLPSPGGEGSAIGDVDTDGDLDVLAGGYWFENNGSAGGWAQHTIVDTNWGSIAVGDINKDGKNDVVIGPMEDSGNDISWYESATPTQNNWLKHVIADNTGNGYHTFRLGDFDGDTRLDLAAGRMSSRSPAPVTIYVNKVSGWDSLQISDKGTHNLRVGDVDADGDLDVFGSNYVGNAGVYLWRNTSQ